jgi:hypothetical protein
MFQEKPTLEMRVYCLDDAILLAGNGITDAYNDMAHDLLIYAGGNLYDHKKSFADNQQVIANAINQEIIADIRGTPPAFN